jgi:hypothetical protein
MAESITDDPFSAMDLDPSAQVQALDQPVAPTLGESAIAADIPVDDVFLNGHADRMDSASSNQPISLDLSALDQASTDQPAMADVLFESASPVQPSSTGPSDHQDLLVEPITNADFEMMVDTMDDTSSSVPMDEFPDLTGSSHDQLPTESSAVESEISPTSGSSDMDLLTAPGAPAELVIHNPIDLRLPYSSRQTGLVYDPRMRFHTELDSSDDVHPEDPRRIYEIFRSLVEAGLVEDETGEVPSQKIPLGFQSLARIQARLAEPTEIAMAHTIDHHKWVENLRSKFYGL